MSEKDTRFPGILGVTVEDRQLSLEPINLSGGIAKIRSSRTARVRLEAASAGKDIRYDKQLQERVLRGYRQNGAEVKSGQNAGARCDLKRRPRPPEKPCHPRAPLASVPLRCPMV